MEERDHDNAPGRNNEKANEAKELI